MELYIKNTKDKERFQNILLDGIKIKRKLETYSVSFKIY